MRRLLLILPVIFLLAGCTAPVSISDQNQTQNISNLTDMRNYYFGGPVEGAASICEDNTYIGTCNPETYQRCGYRRNDAYLRPTLVPDESCQPNPWLQAVAGPYGAIVFIALVLIVAALYFGGYLQFQGKDPYYFRAKIGTFNQIEKGDLRYPWTGTRVLQEAAVQLEDGSLKIVRKFSLISKGNPILTVEDGGYEQTIECNMAGQFGVIRKRNNNNHSQDLKALTWKLGVTRGQMNASFRAVNDQMAPFFELAKEGKNAFGATYIDPRKYGGAGGQDRQSGFQE